VDQWGTWWFVYINTEDQAVAYRSTNQGKTWTFVHRFGTQMWITASAHLTLVYTDGMTVTSYPYPEVGLSEGDRGFFDSSFAGMTAYAELGAVATGSYLVALSSKAGTVRWVPPKELNIDAPPAGMIPIFGVLGEDAAGVSGQVSQAPPLNLLTAGYQDAANAWAGRSAYRVTNVTVQPSNPNDPHSPPITTLQGGMLPNWVGTNSKSLSGFLNFTDFSGFSTGGASGIAFDNSDRFKRGLYFPGYTTASDGNTLYRGDRGLVGPHTTAFGATINNYQVGFFVDSRGLFGSAIDDSVDATADSSGAVSLFSPVKIYGNTGMTFSNLSWGPGSSTDVSGTGSLIVFVLAQPATSGAPATIYRFEDPDPFDRPRPANTELISQTSSINQGLPSTRDPFAISDQSNALGTARTTSTKASYGISFLIDACTDTAILPNPNGSSGCSPILRELLNESGVAYSVVREVANDGDPNSHQGGNALDLAGPDSPVVLVGQSVTAQAYQQMGEIVAFLSQVPELFACVIHLDPISPDNSLFIWDGQIVTSAQFGGDNAQMVQDSISNIHISSSKARLLRGFNNPKVVAALGLSNPYTDPSGNTTSQQDVDPFTADRYVYVNDDGYVGSQTTGLAAEKQPAYIVNFW
jgi:hypothetical protein